MMSYQVNVQKVSVLMVFFSSLAYSSVHPSMRKSVSLDSMTLPLMAQKLNPARVAHFEKQQKLNCQTAIRTLTSPRNKHTLENTCRLPALRSVCAGKSRLARSNSPNLAPLNLMV